MILANSTNNPLMLIIFNKAVKSLPLKLNLNKFLEIIPTPLCLKLYFIAVSLLLTLNLLFYFLQLSNSVPFETIFKNNLIFVLPSRRMLSVELFRLLMPLDSLDMEFFNADGEEGKVGEGVRRRGDIRPGMRLVPSRATVTHMI